MKYQQQNLRKDLNGLRFISIVAVILYHSKISYLTLWFYWRRYFFCSFWLFYYSNFIKSKEIKHLDIFLFLNKRFRRILPALIFVMITSSLAIYFFPSMSQNIQKLPKIVYYILQFFFQIIISINILEIILSVVQTILPFFTWSLSIEIHNFIFFLLFFT